MQAQRAVALLANWKLYEALVIAIIALSVFISLSKPRTRNLRSHRAARAAEQSNGQSGADSSAWHNNDAVASPSAAPQDMATGVATLLDTAADDFVASGSLDILPHPSDRVASVDTNVADSTAARMARCTEEVLQPPAADFYVRISQQGVATGVPGDGTASESMSVTSVMGKLFGGWGVRRVDSPAGVDSPTVSERLLHPDQVTSHVVTSFELSDESGDLTAR